MGQCSYIKLVDASPKQIVTLDDIKDLFQYYKSITSKTGQQLNWIYANVAFPYEIEEQCTESTDCINLISTEKGYKGIALTVNTENRSKENTSLTQKKSYITITLSKHSTHGDKGKANEFCKFLAKKLEAELHLFNGRIMYFNKRK